MATPHLSTYLNDHLAGAVTGLELLGRLREEYAEHPDVRVLEKVEADISEDRATLERLMKRLDVSHGTTRRAADWLVDKAVRMKLAVDDSDDGALRTFEMIEFLSLGIEAKASLWNSLAAIAPADPALSDVNFEELVRRAREQRDAIEPLHIAAARDALVDHHA